MWYGLKFELPFVDILFIKTEELQLKEHEDLSKVGGKEYMTDSDNKCFF
jgi:hypothetical protein